MGDNESNAGTALRKEGGSPGQQVEQAPSRTNGCIVTPVTTRWSSFNIRPSPIQMEEGDRLLRDRVMSWGNVVATQKMPQKTQANETNRVAVNSRPTAAGCVSLGQTRNYFPPGLKSEGEKVVGFNPNSGIVHMGSGYR